MYTTKGMFFRYTDHTCMQAWESPVLQYMGGVGWLSLVLPSTKYKLVSSNLKSYKDVPYMHTHPHKQ